MGKKGKQKNLPNSGAPITLREEATGKIKTKPITNSKAHLRIEHLKKLAVWSTTEPHIPSLGAFYGRHLATVSEAAGVPPDPSLITCQRCETILHPGFNSTVRIEKNKSKIRNKNKKSGTIAQNNVVYKCHFCSHQNLRRGTPKGHLRKIFLKKDKPSLESTPATTPLVHQCSTLEKRIETPSTSTSTPTLSEGKKRKRNSSTPKNPIETPNMSPRVEVAKTPQRVEVAKTQSTASKRRKKSWTSLKEIAQSKNDSQGSNLAIPFFL